MGFAVSGVRASGWPADGEGRLWFGAELDAGTFDELGRAITLTLRWSRARFVE